MPRSEALAYVGRVTEKITGLEGFRNGFRQGVHSKPNNSRLDRVAASSLEGLSQIFSPTFYNMLNDEGQVRAGKSEALIDILRVYVDFGINIGAVLMIVVGYDPATAVGMKVAWNTMEVVADDVSKKIHSPS